jgi:hypothetical protein
MQLAHTRMSSTTARRSAYAPLAAALLAGAIAQIVRGGGGTWQLVAFLAAPDLALLLGFGRGLEKGRLHPRAVPLYNAAHSLWGPALLALASLVLPGAWLVGALGWALHVAFDRAIGYGMRTRDGFQHS